MSVIPGSALDIKRRIAGGEPCPICDGRWFNNGGTQHTDGCLYREYQNLREQSTEMINSLTRQLREVGEEIDWEHDHYTIKSAMDVMRNENPCPLCGGGGRRRGGLHRAGCMVDELLTARADLNTAHVALRATEAALDRKTRELRDCQRGIRR